jgi:hypothetical protein
MEKKLGKEKINIHIGYAHTVTKWNDIFFTVWVVVNN